MIKVERVVALVVLMGATLPVACRSRQEMEHAQRLDSLEAEVQRQRAELDAILNATGQRQLQGPRPEKTYNIEVGASPTLGAPDAAVTIVEWADFECPFCASAAATMKQLLVDYPGQVRLVFKHNPLPSHPRAPLAHQAAMAAAAQGKFWEMHDRIFAAQNQLAREDLRSHAQELGLDLDAFDRLLDAPETSDAIRKDQVLAGRMGPMGVPAFFINGRFIAGAQPYELFRDRVEEALRAP